MKTKTTFFGKAEKTNIYLFFFMGIVIGFVLLLFIEFLQNRIINPSIYYISISILFILCIWTFFHILLQRFKKKLLAQIIEKDEVIHRFEALSNATEDAIWDLDLISNKVFYNERIFSLFGYNIDDLQNNSSWWENNIHPEDKERVMSKVKFFLNSKKSNWKDEYRFKCNDGTYKIIYDRSYIIRNANEEPVRLIGAMKDITRIRNFELEQMNEKLKNKNQIGKNIIRSYEEEKKILKENLHEDVNQLLAIVKLNLEQSLNKYNDSNRNTISYLDTAINKLKRISSQLHSNSFEFFGLEEALYSLFEMYQDINDLDISLNTVDFDEKKADKSISLFLFRLVEHKLAVIIFKLKPKNINISISNTDSSVKLHIIFQSYAPHVISAINEHAVQDMLDKLDIYEGAMQINALENHFFDIFITI